jgi:hypothetical protein
MQVPIQGQYAQPGQVPMQGQYVQQGQPGQVPMQGQYVQQGGQVPMQGQYVQQGQPGQVPMQGQYVQQGGQVPMQGQYVQQGVYMQGAQPVAQPTVVVVGGQQAQRTVVGRRLKDEAWIWFIVLLLCCFPLCWLPFVLDSCYQPVYA